MKRFLVYLAVSVVFAAVLTGPADAKRKPQVAAATCAPATVAAPAEVAAGESFAVTGSCFDPALPSWLRTDNGEASGWLSLTTNPDGTVSGSYVEWKPGTLELSVCQGVYVVAGCGLASTSVTVV